ncbi:hypothetical protein Tco_0512054 [Tanacetum coccineum]
MNEVRSPTTPMISKPSRRNSSIGDQPREKSRASCLGDSDHFTGCIQYKVDASTFILNSFFIIQYAAFNCYHFASGALGALV